MAAPDSVEVDGTGPPAPAAPPAPVGGGTERLLSVRDLRVSFRTDHGDVQAVDGISFDVCRGEVLSIVGESGSGKSVSALSVLGLLPRPTARVDSGEILWKGRDLLTVDDREMRSLRGREIGMVFQDPLSALNPVHRVGRQVAEVLRVHEGLGRKAAKDRAIELLDLVGIPRARQRADSYPHEFSGGMRQRAVIAMAIACRPDLLIADEPTTALDVTVQAQVLEVLVGIKDEIDSAMLLITHDFGVVAGLSDRVLVMYAGREAEIGTTDQVFHESRHPYTLGLLASLPRLDDVSDQPLSPIRGAPPSQFNRPPGCAFHPRCDFAHLPGRCDSEVPVPFDTDAPAHHAACFHWEELVGLGVANLRAGGPG